MRNIFVKITLKHVKNFNTLKQLLPQQSTQNSFYPDQNTVNIKSYTHKKQVRCSNLIS